MSFNTVKEYNLNAGDVSPYFSAPVWMTLTITGTGSVNLFGAVGGGSASYVPQDAHFALVRTYTKPGVYSVNGLPSLLRFFCLSGSVQIRAEMKDTPIPNNITNEEVLRGIDQINAIQTLNLASINQLNSAVQQALIASATNSKFISVTTAPPLPPSQVDLIQYPGDIRGFRFNASGAVQPILWNRTTQNWDDVGQPSATSGDVAALQGQLSTAQKSLSSSQRATIGLTTRADLSAWDRSGLTYAFVDTSRWSWRNGGVNTDGVDVIPALDGGIWVRETNGVLSNSRRPSPVGPVGVVEESASGVSSPTQSIQYVTFGLGAAATGRSYSNVPGARVQVNAVSNLSQLAGYGFDAVGDYVNMDANPALYSVASGVGVFTATNVTLPTPLPALAVPGMFMRTTHPERWYGAITAISASRLVATVSAWYNGNTAATGTPPNGTGAAVLLNPLDTLFGRNLLVGFGPNAPTRVGVGEELDMYMAGGDVSAAGYDVVPLGDGGSSSSKGAFQSRWAAAGRFRWSFVSLGNAYDTSFASIPHPLYPNGPAPQNDFDASHGTVAGYRSKGNKFHADYYDANGASVFRVQGNGDMMVKGLSFGRAALIQFSTATDVPTLKNDVNSILTALKNAGLMSS